MPSSLPVFPEHNNTKYYIHKMEDGRFAVLNKESDYLLTISRTYDRAAKHIMASTGKYPRCIHEWQRVRLFATHWKTGIEANTGAEKIDALKCIVCGTAKKIQRIVDRNIKRKKWGGKRNNAYREKSGNKILYRLF